MPGNPDSPEAIRKRRQRERQKDGLRVAPVEVADAVIGALIDRGWLSPDEARDPALVADAITDLAESWVRGNLTCGHIIRNPVTRD